MYTATIRPSHAIYLYMWPKPDAQEAALTYIERGGRGWRVVRVQVLVVAQVPDLHLPVQSRRRHVPTLYRTLPIYIYC